MTPSATILASKTCCVCPLRADRTLPGEFGPGLRGLGGPTRGLVLAGGPLPFRAVVRLVPHCSATRLLGSCAVAFSTCIDRKPPRLDSLHCWRDQWFDAAAHFVEHYDQNCFDPDFDSEPLATFEPMIRKIFARPSDDDIDQQVRFGT